HHVAAIEVGPDVKGLVANRVGQTAGLPEIIGEAQVGVNDPIPIAVDQALDAVAEHVILVVGLLLQHAAVARVLVILLGRGQLVFVVIDVGPGLGRGPLGFLGEVALRIIGICVDTIGAQLIARPGTIAAIGPVPGPVVGQVIGAVRGQLVGVIVTVGR